MKTLRFKLDVVVTSTGEVCAVDLRVRDMVTRKSESLWGYSGPNVPVLRIWNSITARVEKEMYGLATKETTTTGGEQ